VSRVVAVIVCALTFEHEAIVRTALQNGSFIIYSLVVDYSSCPVFGVSEYMNLEYNTWTTRNA